MPSPECLAATQKGFKDFQARIDMFGLCAPFIKHVSSQSGWTRAEAACPQKPTCFTNKTGNSKSYQLATTPCLESILKYDGSAAAKENMRKSCQRYILDTGRFDGLFGCSKDTHWKNECPVGAPAPTAGPTTTTAPTRQPIAQYCSQNPNEWGRLIAKNTYERCDGKIISLGG
jgi:hypothetical protein